MLVEADDVGERHTRVQTRAHAGPDRGGFAPDLQRRGERGPRHEHRGERLPPVSVRRHRVGHVALVKRVGKRVRHDGAGGASLGNRADVYERPAGGERAAVACGELLVVAGEDVVEAEIGEVVARGGVRRRAGSNHVDREVTDRAEMKEADRTGAGAGAADRQCRLQIGKNRRRD
ncbi:MAG TPA: hypothetical protein VEO74_11635, partial [Thermoanaerobaculia bacterium]|nr:hypothetical protein [Thermoanaerobaculia bacterium]